MKVKDFLEWFNGFDPESELEFYLFEEKINGCGDYEEFHTPLDVADVNYLDETDIVFVTLEWGDLKMSIKDLKDKVLSWADDKDSLHSENADKQFMKFI